MSGTIRVTISGLREAQAALRVARDTIANIGQSGAIHEMVNGVSDVTLQNVQSKGTLLSDGTQGRMPWGEYADTYRGALGQMKTQGETYQLVDTATMVTSVTLPWSRYFQLEQGASSFTLTTLVIYAAHVQNRWGAWFGPGEAMRVRIERDLRAWLVANLPGGWSAT